MKGLLVPVIAMTMLLTACGGGQKAGKSQVLKLSHNHADGYPVDRAYKKFAELVAQKSGGRYTVEIYPSAQLGDQRASLELAQSGVLHFAHINTAVLEGFDSIYGVLNLPYIFKDYAHYRAVMDSPKVRQIFEDTLPKGFVPVIYLEGGARSFYTKDKPINTPDDLRGLKIRVQDSPTSIEMVRLLGGTPVAMNFSEVYTALQQGVIDGAENNAPSLITTGHAEVAKNFSLNNHMRLSDILVVGGDFWKSISEEDRAMFRESANETIEFFAGVWDADEKLAFKEAEEKYNVKITHPNTELFRAKVFPMHEAMAKKDPRFKELIDYIKTLEK